MWGSWLRTGGGNTAPGSSLSLSFALKLISYVSQVVLVNQTCSPGHYIVFFFPVILYCSGFTYTSCYYILLSLLNISSY